MVAGHLQEKNGHYYIVLNYCDNGKRKSKWISTGLAVKNNKRRAEAMLLEAREKFVPDTCVDKTLFTDFLASWLEMMKSCVEQTTFASYQSTVQRRIIPYFQPLQLRLDEIQPKHIQTYYTYLLSDQLVSANTVKHHHANIRKALQYALKTDLIVSNPADKVELPKINKFVGSFYSKEEVSLLFAAVNGTKIELAVHLAVFYGLRRSEVCGLKWENVDFHTNCFTVADTVAQAYLDGHTVIVQKSRPKNQSSNRTYPLAPQHREMLERLRAQQAVNQKTCGRSYCKDFLAYVNVNEMGTLISANYISQQFQNTLQKHGLRKIRFHDLRHTCASLLLANGVGMKEIQDWLGHSDYSTTANIYAHLDFGKKFSSAETMSRILG